MWSHKGYSKLSPDFKVGVFLGKHITNIEKLMGCNVIMYGPYGAGKYRILDAVLRNIGIVTTLTMWSNKLYTLDNDKRSEISLLVRQSHIHSEFMIKDMGANERHVVKYIINDLSKNLTISNDGNLTYKVIVIHNIDFLSSASHDILSTFMEKYVSGSRFVLLTSKFNVISVRLKSRCVLYRVARPSRAYLASHLKYILKCENKTMDDNLLYSIIDNCDNHIDNTINSVQLHIVNAHDSTSALYDDIVSMFMKKASIKKIRDLIYVLIVNDTNTSSIFKNITKRIAHVWSAHPEKITNLYHNAVFFEWSACVSERNIYHIEAFLVSIRKHIT
jgi:replication factor C subunit 3/5